MFEAELGDDCYGEDPTVAELEQYAAELMGKESALYVTSGTQGNLVAQLAHTRPGEELILGEKAHTFTSEVGAAARIAGLSLYRIPQRGASLDLDALRYAIRPVNIHYPRTGLIWVEQPAQGFVMPLDELDAIARIGKEKGIPVHIDGARIFHAAIYLGIEAAKIAYLADSVMFCVSKGLAAPVGSLVVGSGEFIDRARRFRKLLGGGMRQAGVIAAGALYALRFMRERLKDDHNNARAMAKSLERVPGICVDRTEVQTNMFYFCLKPSVVQPVELCEMLKKNDLLVNTPNPGTNWIRVVTHYGIDVCHVSKAAEIIANVIQLIRAQSGELVETPEPGEMPHELRPCR